MKQRRITTQRRITRKAIFGTALGAAACLVLAACSGGSGSSTSSPASPPDTATISAPPPAPSPSGRPNIVFVLTDDLSKNLVPYMPHVQALQKQGTSFSNYTVTDSLCCPSRSSIFSGKDPHDTRIFTNQDGFGRFHSRGEENETFATALRQVGYHTALMGKYLNGYQPRAKLGGSRPYVPPGWNEWAGTGSAYGEYDYDLNEDHQVRHYGRNPADYLTDVLRGRAVDFVHAQARAHAPFFLEVATFAPHLPYVPAPRDAHSFPDVRAPRTPAYDTLPEKAPPWLVRRTPLAAKQVKKIDAAFRKRVQAVQAVDRMIGSLEDTLKKDGVAGDTDIVFSSDNGYHMGEYRLMPGKQTAFDTDVNVPLVAAGPGIKAGRTVSAVAQNTDLGPTFETLGGATPPADVDGHTLTPLLAGESDAGWRTAGLVEHHGPNNDPTDPDHPQRYSGNPPSYEALRTRTYTYVEYADDSKEFYDRSTDPLEMRNEAVMLPAARLASLHDALHAMATCHGAASCWRAGHLAH